MSFLGSYLRELRERRGVSLDEISRVTRVARSYLEALEQGEHVGLPAPVFVRGFIRAYCQVLGEAPDEALALYDPKGVDATEARTETAVRPARADRHHGAILVSFVLLVVLGAALLAVTIALQSGRNGATVATTAVPAPRPVPSEPVPPAAAPSILTPQTPATPAPALSPAGAPHAAGTTPPAAASAPATTPSAPTKRDAGSTASVTPSAATSPTPSDAPDAKVADHRPVETAASPPPVAGGVKEAERVAAAVTSPYRLTARASEATWMRVRTEDGRQLSEETIPAGQVREWVSNRRFELTVGNAGGVRLELNGHALPLLGAAREVVKVVLPPETP